MPISDKPSLGIYGNYWEYRRTTHRRLILSSDFSQEEALEIGERLEKVDSNWCKHPVNCRGREIIVYIGGYGQVRRL